MMNNLLTTSVQDEYAESNTLDKDGMSINIPVRKTPFELVFKRKPHLMEIHKFGGRCYSHIPLLKSKGASLNDRGTELGTWDHPSTRGVIVCSR
jgi:hypothetical protein